MDGCMTKARDIGPKDTKSELPAKTPAAGPKDDAVSAEGMVMAGLQSAEASVTQAPAPAEAEGMVFTEIDLDLDAASPGFSAAADMWSAEDAPVEEPKVQAANPFDAPFEKIAGFGFDAVAGEETVSHGMRNTVDASLLKESAAQEADLSETMLENTASVRSDAVTEESMGSRGMRNAGDTLLFKESMVQATDSSDALLEKIAGVRSGAAEEEAAPLLRQLPDPSDRNETEPSRVAASDERNALKESDMEFIPVREPAPSVEPVPAGAGFAGAVQEAAHPTNLIPASPAAMPQKLFEVGDHSFILTRKSDTSVELTLSPPGVGKLNIEVVLSKGIINANIFAADSKGVDAIERSLPRILQMLASEGIAVGGFNVSLKGGGYQGKEAQQADDGTLKSDSVDSVAPKVARSAAAKSGLVDIFV